MIDGSDEPQSFGEKLATLVADHRRFVEEFDRSLGNARHFVQLADKSMEKEPVETIAMLEQIWDIDLMGHVKRLSEEFDRVRGFLTASTMEAEAEEYRETLVDLADEYERLETEAKAQLEQIQRLLAALKG